MDYNSFSTYNGQFKNGKFNGDGEIQLYKKNKDKTYDRNCPMLNFKGKFENDSMIEGYVSGNIYFHDGTKQYLEQMDIKDFKKYIDS